MSIAQRVYPNKPAIREEIERTLIQAFFYAGHHHEAGDFGLSTGGVLCDNPFLLSEPNLSFIYAQIGSYAPRRYFNLESFSHFRRIVFLYGVVGYFMDSGDAADRLECLIRELVEFRKLGRGSKSMRCAAAE